MALNKWVVLTSLFLNVSFLIGMQLGTFTPYHSLTDIHIYPFAAMTALVFFVIFVRILIEPYEITII